MIVNRATWVMFAYSSVEMFVHPVYYQYYYTKRALTAVNISAYWLCYQRLQPLYPLSKSGVITDKEHL